jgi:hypothetical protein
MDRADLKRLLRIARKDPVHMAFALGGDGKPIIMLDKRKQPRALEKGIKEGAPDAKNHRFGCVSIDPDNPKLAIFTVNKAASGMARRLVIALKGTGCSKVQILLDDGTAVEVAEGEPEADNEEQEDGRQEAADDDGADPANEPEAPDDASGQAAAPPAAADPTSATTAQDDTQAAAQPDAATLTQTLTGLVKQMMGVIAKDPSQKAALAELATDAQASLKRGDLAQAAAGIEVLRQAIEAAGTGAPTTGAAGAAPDPQQPPGTTTGTDTDAPAPDTQATQDGAPAQDAAGLLAELTAVVKQLMPIVAADQAQRDAAKNIVTQAQASLKSGDLDTARELLDNLRAMLGGQPAADATQPAAGAEPKPAADGAPGNGAAATFAKSRLVWVAARKKVDGDIAKLHDEFMGVFKDHAKADDIGAAFRKRVGSVMDKLDESLADKLDTLANNTDPSQHATLVQEAKQLVQDYQTYLANEPLIATLDSNPFTPLTIQKTMTATLSALGKALG